MPRIARIIGVGYPHHIIQKGNSREKVFLLGKPLGNGGFLNTLSEKLGCSLSFRPKGRPREK